MLLTWLIFTIIFGACVGSFLNVVVYRLPLNLSVVTPPSACPQCGHRLAWFDNVPVLGWIMLRGKCRYCANSISAQYPVIEALTAGLFGLLFYVCYMTDLRPDFSGAAGNATGAIFAIHLLLVGGLLASTLVDARHYIIPLEIPWIITLLALIVLPINAAIHPHSIVRITLPPNPPTGLMLRSERLAAVGEPYAHAAAVKAAARRSDRMEAITLSAAPLATTSGTVIALGGAAGLAVMLVLLRLKVIPRSFSEDIPANTSNDPRQWMEHPHPRREMLKECLFVAGPVIGAGAASMLVQPAQEWPAWLNVLGGAVLGYLAGAAVVWAIRIFGTLGLGKEAMGLGDAHLMAAVGAVCGWQTALLAFFLAPFFGLAWHALTAGLAAIARKRMEPMPYGPHLALASYLVILLREPLLTALGAYLLPA